MTRFLVQAFSVLVPAACLGVLSVAVSKATADDPRPEKGSPQFKLSFAPGKIPPGSTRVSADTVYSKELGYGFDLGSKVTCYNAGRDVGINGGYCSGDKPFFFSVALPEGNYNVRVTVGAHDKQAVTTVKAEQRRLLMEKEQTGPGQFVTQAFTVNVRTPRIATGGEVRLKDREKTTETLTWDEKLTLEFNNTRPCLAGLEITRADDAVTLFIMGDSTVCDQPLEPWTSWGQMLPRFFRSGLAVANYAESGETLKSSQGAKRLDKVLSVMKKGDYLFIQFGHNDMKEKGDGVGPFTTYKASLKHYITEARKRGGLPVLITPMHRKSLNASGTVTNTHGDYPEAVRQAAAEEQVPLIDLHAMSKVLYEALGPKDVGKAFQDGSHHNAYGSYELARCIVDGIKQNKLEIARFIAEDVLPFDPKKPDPPGDFKIPASPQSSSQKPSGD
jgi:lysophospholipase L1-like esterase